MNIRKYTQWAESPEINSVGQRPANRNRSCNQALKGRHQWDYAPLGLSGLGVVSMTGRCPILMMTPILGYQHSIGQYYGQSFGYQ